MAKKNTLFIRAFVAKKTHFLFVYSWQKKTLFIRVFVAKKTLFIRVFVAKKIIRESTLALLVAKRLLRSHTVLYL